MTDFYVYCDGKTDRAECDDWPYEESAEEHARRVHDSDEANMVDVENSFP